MKYYCFRCKKRIKGSVVVMRVKGIRDVLHFHIFCYKRRKKK